MRILILTGILGLALPALAVGGPEPTPENVSATGVAAESIPMSEVGRHAPAPVAAPEPVEPEPALEPLSGDAVRRGTFATEIDRREPVDSIESLENDRDRVYYFTELVGIPGREVTHRWMFQGSVVAEVPIAVNGPRWRAYSSKSLDAGQLGEWTVSVVDETGTVLRTDHLVYEEATTEPEAAPAAMAAPAATPVTGEIVDETPAKTGPSSP